MIGEVNGGRGDDGGWLLMDVGGRPRRVRDAGREAMLHIAAVGRMTPPPLDPLINVFIVACCNVASEMHRRVVRGRRGKPLAQPP
jgi:hypothetical protein